MQEVYLLTAQKQMSDSSDEVGGGGRGLLRFLLSLQHFKMLKLKLWDGSLLKPLWTPF